MREIDPIPQEVHREVHEELESVGLENTFLTEENGHLQDLVTKLMDTVSSKPSKTGKKKVKAPRIPSIPSLPSLIEQNLF